jgi:hypothetical protein
VKIAFIGHSYHQKTRSHGFFLDLLKKLGSVHLFYDTTWLGKPSPWVETFRAADYDTVVIWQVEQAFSYLPPDHPHVVFVPMFDAMMSQGALHWKEAFDAAKIVCFSSELYKEVSQYTKRATFARYYPDPSGFPAPRRDGRLRGIFWKRVREINECIVARLCGDFRFDRFSLHDAPDPMSGAELMKDPPLSARTIARDVWVEQHSDYLRHIAAHNVFFAPRPAEGIGMALLEAMAMGLCVVAPDSPTHNEYIRDGETGFLYDLANPQPVDLSRADPIGDRARQAMAEGALQWSAAQEGVLEFVANG